MNIKLNISCEYYAEYFIGMLCIYISNMNGMLYISYEYYAEYFI